jgi:hypothetical protein
LQSRHSTTWATLSVHFFCFCYFRDGASWTICLGLLQTLVLPILTSQVARITTMSHWCLAEKTFFFLLKIWDLKKKKKIKPKMWFSIQQNVLLAMLNFWHTLHGWTLKTLC